MDNTPVIGESNKIFGQVVIEANDDANGILQLSSSEITVSEETILPVVFVNRSAGLFGEVR